MPNFVVPPGGLTGFSQMTPASRAALFPGGRSGGAKSTTRRRRSSKRTKKASGSGKRRTSGRKMKFGSPAWQKKYKVGKHAKKKK